MNDKYCIKVKIRLRSQFHEIDRDKDEMVGYISEMAMLLTDIGVLSSDKKSGGTQRGHDADSNKNDKNGDISDSSGDESAYNANNIDNEDIGDINDINDAIEIIRGFDAGDVGSINNIEENNYKSISVDGENVSDTGEFVQAVIDSIFKNNTETLDLYTEGELYYGDGRIEIRYGESELTGLGETVTSVSFDESDRGLITILRGGDIYSAIVLQRGVRHLCVYETEGLPIEIYTTAKRVINSLTDCGGTLEMIYTVETHDEPAQFNRMCLTVEPFDAE